MNSNDGIINLLFCHVKNRNTIDVANKNTIYLYKFDSFSVTLSLTNSYALIVSKNSSRDENHESKNQILRNVIIVLNWSSKYK